MNKPDTRHILVVDDEEATRYTVCRYLKQAGFQIWEASTGKDALRLAEQGPDLVVLDVQLPDMLGYEVCRTLKANPRTSDIPVLHISATFHKTADKVHGLDGGADAYLTWPLDPEELLANVRVLLRLRSAQELLHKANEELESKIEARTAKLKDAVAELEGFTYSLTHDMRAPLRAMQGFARILLDEYGTVLDEQGADYLQRISSAASRLDELILDALNYGRIVRAEISVQPVDLDDLVHGITRDYPGFQPPHAEISIQGVLPRVWGNEALLTQCVSNLLSNAVKFVRPGVPPRVAVLGQHRGDFQRLVVRDNGIGIAPEHQERIFNMFERLHGPSEFSGTGIGLTIVRKAVERLGGRFGVESALGQGSSFWIELKSADVPLTNA